jgi:hypothetical protein
MRLLVLALSTLLFTGALAQVSRTEAEARVANMAGAMPGGRETVIWSMTASDADLVGALASPRGDRAMAAAWEVHRRRKPELVRAEAAALPKADLRVGLAIVNTLRLVGTPLARRAVEAAVRHPEPRVRWAAAEASAAWGYRGARPALVEAVDRDETAAVSPLGQVGARADLPVLRRFYERSVKRGYQGWGPNPIHLSLLAMARLRDDRALRMLREEVDHPSDEDLRAGAVEALAAVGDKGDVPRLIRTLQDPDMNVRFVAAEALGEAQVRAAIPALRELAARPGPDAAQGKINESRDRRYVSYVADCLEKRQKPMSRQEWHLRNPLMGTGSDR